MRLSRAQRQRVWVLRRTVHAALAGSLMATGLLLLVPSALGVMSFELAELGVSFVVGAFLVPPAMELVRRAIAPRSSGDELQAWRALFGAAIPRALAWSALLLASPLVSLALWLAAAAWLTTRTLRTSVARAGDAHVAVGWGPLARHVALDAVVAVAEADLDHVARTGRYRERIRLVDRNGALVGELTPGRADHDALARLLRDRAEAFL